VRQELGALTKSGKTLGVRSFSTCLVLKQEEYKLLSFSMAKIKKSLVWNLLVRRVELGLDLWGRVSLLSVGSDFRGGATRNGFDKEIAIFKKNKDNVDIEM
jgi:hypothetical protein